MAGVSNTALYYCLAILDNIIVYPIPGSCMWGSKLVNYKFVSGLYLYLLTLSTLLIKKCMHYYVRVTILSLVPFVQSFANQ